MLAIANIRVTPDALKLVADIHEFRGRWAVTENLATTNFASLRETATIESVGSSTRLDGGRLADAGVKSLLVGPRTSAFANRDENDVVRYAKAINKVINGYETMPPTEDLIRQLHSLLLNNTTADHRSEYKSVTNQFEVVGRDGERFDIIAETATALETPRLMSELVDWYNESIYKQRHHPLVLIGIFIAVFLAIHPFDEGNGRLSRILTTLLLLRAGYGYVPYSSMETLIEEDKVGYCRSMRDTLPTIRTTTQNWEPWLGFFLETLVKQQNKLAAEMNKQASLAALPKISREIVRLAKNRGEITIKDIEHLTHYNRNTIKLHVKNLVERHYLTLVGKGRGAGYTINHSLNI